MTVMERVRASRVVEKARQNTAYVPSVFIRGWSDFCQAKGGFLAAADLFYAQHDFFNIL